MQTYQSEFPTIREEIEPYGPIHNVTIDDLCG